MSLLWQQRDFHKTKNCFSVLVLFGVFLSPSCMQLQCFREPPLTKVVIHDWQCYDSRSTIRDRRNNDSRSTKQRSTIGVVCHDQRSTIGVVVTINESRSTINDRCARLGSRFTINDRCTVPLFSIQAASRQTNP